MIPPIRASLVAISISLSSYLVAYDNGHFYRATNFFYEPRLEHDWLTSFQVTFGGGSTCHGRNGNSGLCNAQDMCTTEVPLFDIYGTNNMQQLGVGVPNKDLQNVNDLILIQLANLPTNGTFGQFSIGGKFSILEANFLFTQNLCNGFFLQAHLPLRNLKVSDIGIIDISPGNNECFPDNGRCPNAHTPIWQTFLRAFPSILEQYGLNLNPFDKTGIGDLSVLFGWTINYQEMNVLDYIDATIQVGFMAPTSPETCANDLFALPLGYNGHWGFPIQFDVALGAYEWVTVGGHLDAIIFTNVTRFLHMKTSPAQQGIIKLASGCAEEKRGTLWNGSIYFKADHVIHGFSFLLGYSFTQQNSISLLPCNTDIFDPAIVNTDAMFAGWNMNTLHIAFDYDFTCNESSIGTHVGIFYNHVISGERIFETNIVGGQVGIDVTWNF